MDVAEAVGAALVRHGVSQVFGVVGSGNFTVTNAMVAGGARFVAARHEGGAATMADAYARMSGAVASAVWSTAKLDRGDVASAARTTSGVRLLAASVMPVIALVSPQPWWTLSAATAPDIRA